MVQEITAKNTSLTLASVENDRSNNFDFLRFVLATLVLFYHCFPLLLGAGERKAGFVEQAAGFGAGSAVDFFFVISGFLVTQSWVRTPSIGLFLRKRVLRIFPAFIGVSLFCALVVGPLGAANLHEYIHHFHPLGFLAYILLLVGPYLPPVFLTLPFAGQVDGSFWTLRYEFECYLLVLVLGLTGAATRRIGVVVLFAVLTIFTFLSAIGHAVPVPDRELHLIGNPIKWFRLLPFFLTGMAFYQFRDRIRYTPAFLVLALIGIVLGAIFSQWQNLALSTCGSYLLFWAAFRPMPSLSRFARHGDFSYGLYLYAYPIQQLLILFYGPHLNPLGLFCIAFPISLSLAALSWHGLEKPALKLRKGAAQVMRA